MSVKYEILKCPEDLQVHEKNFYQVFYKDDKEKKWDLSDYEVREDRLVSQIPYDQFMIFGVKYNNLLVSDLSVFPGDRVLKKSNFQYHINDNICEAYKYYILKDHPVLIGLGAGIMDMIQGFHQYLYRELYNRGMRYLYASCYEDLLGFYTRFGEFEVVDKQTANGHKAFLMIKEIPAPSI